MAERKKTNESANKIDLLYKWLSYDLQKMRNELMNEMKYSSLQVGSLYSQLKGDRESEVSQITQELRYTYKQNQNIYDGLSTIITDEVGTKLDSMEEKFGAVEQVKELLGDIGELKYSYQQLQASYESLSGVLSEEVAPKVDAIVSKLEVLDQLETIIAENNRQLLDAVAAITPSENVDYERIVDEVGDKMLELLNQLRAEEQPAPAPAAVEIDYDRIIDGTVEKVVESMPYVPKIDMDALAVAVAAKIAAPVIDYERLADLVADRLAAKTQQTYDVTLDESGIDAIADKVAEKLSGNAIDYDKVCLAAQAAQIIPDPVDYERIGEIVEDKLANAPMDLMLDEEGINAIARGVADQLTVEEVYVEEVVEEVPAEEPVAEEVVEETATEEVVEETVEEVAVEEPVEEVVEEVAVEEVAAEVPMEDVMPAQEELAVAAGYQEDEIGQLVDAETGLVIRLKKSFTAKMKQSEEKIKGYYSELKNALVAYKKINSNVSWHGDRFNFGRDTVAKMTIVGKTLNLYLDLDPNDPEFKTTVYHQKDVGNQKAYESTPFMVKIKSDAALKKALRLVVALGEKLGTEKEEKFEPINYVEEFAYQTTKQLFEEGFIKATKEKKVDLNF